MTRRREVSESEMKDIIGPNLFDEHKVEEQTFE
jgi:hypothetical protein